MAMVRIDKTAILNDLKRNWGYFLALSVVGAIVLLRTEYRSGPVVFGVWIAAGLPVLLAAGMAVRYIWAGWLQFGRP